jgi:hypothetical protein
MAIRNALLGREIDQRREADSIGQIFATTSEWPTIHELARSLTDWPELLGKWEALFAPTGNRPNSSVMDLSTKWLAHS